MNRFSAEEIAKIKNDYPVGTKVRLINMVDCRPVEPGTCGTVRLVDDVGTIHVNWDNGSGLGLIPGIDNFELI